jgi:capsular polysaccharide export protein
MADASSFSRMLEAALSENPDCTVLLKVHPDVVAGRKIGHFDPAVVSRNPRVHVLGRDAHPVSLIERARAVYTVTSQIGFESLLWGKSVRTFGMPFYAGWGLTQDDLAAPKRRAPATLQNLAHAALIAYPRYLDPETGTRCEAERLIDWMGLQRRMRERFPERIYARGFSPWKKPIVRAFFQGSDVKFVRTANKTPCGAMLLVWGRKEMENRTCPLPEGEEKKIVRLEDGFLRSVGLGADLVRPLSWIADSCGMYYDATGPSELEQILQTTAFDPAVLARAKALRERITALGLTKYNVGASIWQRPDTRRRVLLVPGQVETDASIRFGTAEVRTNAGLLRAVREANPGAYVIYKPHPDVAAGLRRRGIGEDDAFTWCDELLTDVSMGALLDAVDEVHIMTSLAGFEALLRGRRVATYGTPFYAGWGLTVDRTPSSRRTRCLSLDELVAGVLIEYPAYVSRSTGRFTTPERALDELAAWRERNGQGLPWWRSVLRVALRLKERWD